MADLIKIPFGFVVALSGEELSIILSCLKTAIKILEGTTEQDELEAQKFLEKLVFELLTPKSSYGSENMN